MQTGLSLEIRVKANDFNRSSDLEPETEKYYAR